MGKWKTALQAAYIVVFQQKEGNGVGKLPPIVKVYEAYNVLVDDRIVVKEQEALVDSSDYVKTYTVRFHGDEVSNNDNATIWQHYPDYPILAVRMRLGIFFVDWNILPAFAGINWKKHNTEHRNRYEEVIEEFLSECEGRDYACEDMCSCIQETLETVAKSSYTIKGNRAPMICK